MRNNKGITLIALVITIIVMLTLVGVTITVAMQGGLFNTARKAATGTEAEKEKELQIASGIYEGKTLEEWAAGEVATGNNAGETIKQSTEVGGKILYSYDGTKANEKEWTVLYNNGDTIEIISPDVIGSLTLGAEYEETVGDIDNDGTANTEIDKAIYSYNNGIDIINNYCSSIVTNPNKISVRSTGTDPNNISKKNTEVVTFKQYPTSIYSGLLEGSDENYQSDYTAVYAAGASMARRIGEPDNAYYWLGSRNVSYSSDGGTFSIRMACYNNGNVVGVGYHLVGFSKGTISPRSETYGVRPVVKISTPTF